MIFQEEYSLSLWICPLCGKQNSTRYYDPTDFVNDILMIRKRGLGKGKGFEETERYSLLDGSDPELLELISDRVAVLYDLLFEDVEDDDESEDEEEEVDFESLSELDKELLLAEREDAEDDDEDDDDEAEDEVDFESLSELDKELFLADREETEAEKAEDEDE